MIVQYESCIKLYVAQLKALLSSLRMSLYSATQGLAWVLQCFQLFSEVPCGTLSFWRWLCLDAAFLESSSENGQTQRGPSLWTLALDSNTYVNSGFVIQLGTNTANKKAEEEKQTTKKEAMISARKKERGVVGNDKDKGDNVPTARPWCADEKSFTMELDRQSGWLCLLWRQDIQPASLDSSAGSGWSVAIDRLILVYLQPLLDWKP